MCGGGSIIEDALDLAFDIVETAVNLVSSVVDAAVGLFSAAFSLVGMPFGLDMGAPNVEQAQINQIGGVLVNKDAATNHVPVVYGTRRLGGSRVFISTRGDNNKYLYVALILAEGKVNGYTKLYIDDNEVPLTTYAHGEQATPTTGEYANKLVAQFFDGRADQTVSSLLQEAPGWSSTHRLQGLSYIACRYEWAGFNTTDNPNNNPYKGLPRINVLLQGKLIKDATTLTVGHSTAYDDETTTFTNNPVSVLLDYLRNDLYGKGLTNSSFDWESWKIAADLCDQTVDYTESTTGKAFTTDAVIDTGQTIMNNVKLLLANFRGIMPYQTGKYYLKIEHGGDDTDIAATPTDPNTVFHITTDHIIGGVNLQGPDKKNKINRAVITYVDPDSDYQANQVAYPEDGSADDVQFLQEDGIRLETRYTYNMITNREQALQMAQVMVKRSRNNQVITLQTSTDAANVSVGDLVRITNANISLDGIFRIQSVELNAQGTVDLSATQHNASDYAINAKSTAPAVSAINLPNPFLVSAPTNITASSDSTHSLQSNDGTITHRIRVSWTASTDPFVNSYVIQFKRTAESTYTTAVETPDTVAFISPVAVGESYDIRVYARNNLGRYSTAASVLNHTVADTYTPAGGSPSSVSSSGSSITIGATQLGA